MPAPPLPTYETEIKALEACLSQCREKLTSARLEGMDLQADLLQEDLNSMLDRLSQLYARREVQHGNDVRHDDARCNPA